MGETLGGAVVLNGTAETGDMVYYDLKTQLITGQSPEGETWGVWGLGSLC